MARYRFVTTWRAAAPVAKVWDALQCLSAWWPGMTAPVHLTPGTDGVGARYERVTRGKLPYDLRYFITVTRYDPPREMAYDSEGDLVGHGSYVLTETGGETQVVRPRPFSAFQNPFVDGSAERLSPNEITRYSFEAFQAWAWERGLGRQPGETPLEFADRVGEEFPALEHAARRLVNYYAQMAYARATLSRACREPLREFWQLLVEVVERPMSAGVGSA